MGFRESMTFIVLVGTVACICTSLNGEGRGEYSFVREATKNGRWESYYDYIIVGGGTAGCPLAATLSHNATVLLLERGGSPYGNSNISRIENFYRNLVDVGSCLSPTQGFISEDGVSSARARVLGGGTCLNAGFYSRASSKEIGAMGLEPSLVEQSYAWIENTIVHRPPRNNWQSAMAASLVEAGVSPFNGFTYDHRHGTKIGGTTFDHSGRRFTAADILQYANPRNLTVLLRATVQRVLFTSEEGTKPKAYGVVFRDADGVEHRALLKDKKSEVIIAAGALGSPQLLILSGIGPAEESKSLGIKMVINQPAVGKGMADNPTNVIIIPTQSFLEFSLIQAVGITNFGIYIEASSGYLVSEKYAAEMGGVIIQEVAGPFSKGHLRLYSSNVEDNPVVSFNYFHHPRDLRRCVRGFKTIKKLIRSKSMKRFIKPKVTMSELMNLSAQTPVTTFPSKAKDKLLFEQFCKETVRTMWHYHGGCQVGRVVDQDYKVIGAENVRVIDGSTFNFSPGTNPQATVMMLGRYVGVRILKERWHPAAEVLNN